ncbi:unnamed protein product [Prunus armeniaca]|uniref:Uncharacterized protein n=1 Tax=Prunus armeniaca TaxID=36596 RepID=A0A6J5XWG1_PRUAR|nr:hypothetical protein GBA52_015360 [Prunus armeniaca]CAB4286139.1 unnamed protein product [Prunus armeniaca]CAB4316573.1 unnamed protein product [Prunus armeniaca]
MGSFTTNHRKQSSVGVCRISFLPFPSSILVSRGLDDTLLENCLGPVTGSYENVVRMLRCRRLAGKRTGK